MQAPPATMDKSFVMKCPYCGGDVVETFPYTECSKFFGKITVDFPDEKCTQCGASYMSYELSKALNAEYQRRICDFLLRQHNPLQHRDEYYDAEETTRILDLNKTIDANMYEYFIYRMEFNGELLFWKPSLDLFKSTRDGRIPI